MIDRIQSWRCRKDQKRYIKIQNQSRTWHKVQKIHITSRNLQKSIKFIEKSHKIKTNLEWTEKNQKIPIKAIISRNISRISYKPPKSQGKII